MKVIIAGGGTGGHIYPAIAIADKIMRKKPDAKILFIGTEKGLESKLVPERGYDIKYISARGFNRKNPMKNLATIRDFIKGSRQSERIVDEFKPDIVIGTGGYVSGPVLWVSGRKGIRTFIHEQNAFPGLTNKMLARYVEKIFISFPESANFFKDKKKIEFTGNPVRKEFIVSSIFDYRKELGVGEGDFFILSFGGSGGAGKVNEAILDMSEIIAKTPNVRLVHITGNYYYEEYCKKLQAKGLSENDKITVLPYSKDIHKYMLASDLVICRAGAITVAELTACGKASILIPSPNVTANHQFYNGKAIADKGGGILIEEKDLTSEKLSSVVMRLMNNKEALNRMSEISGSLGRVDGADGIYLGLGI